MTLKEKLMAKLRERQGTPAIVETAVENVETAPETANNQVEPVETAAENVEPVETPENIIEQLKSIIEEKNLHNIKIEKIGNWLWATGEGCREINTELKSLGFYFSRKKVAWYNTGGKRHFRRGKYNSVNEIKQIYNSEEELTA